MGGCAALQVLQREQQILDGAEVEDTISEYTARVAGCVGVLHEYFEVVIASLYMPPICKRDACEACLR